MFEFADLDKDGFITFDDFEKIMSNIRK
jgi:Ca2+-binding EF-hand superfamily protein